MNALRVALLILCLLLFPTAAAAAPDAAPLAGPCAPGAAYDPACDVDHDGDVDIFDIQLTASRWNRTGTWVSDNDHNHLGQTWTGNNNPLVIQGAFGLPGVAPLVLTNSGAGDGLWITGAGKSGVFIGPTGNDGVYVQRAGTPRTTNTTSLINGLEIAGAQDTGVYVGHAGDDGIRVASADGDGLLAGQIAGSGVRVDNAGVDGVRVLSADAHGLHVFSAGGSGLQIDQAGGTGVHVNAAGGHGIDIVNASGGTGVVVRGASNHGIYVNNTGINGIRIDPNFGEGWAGISVAGPDRLSGYFEGRIFVGDSCNGCRLATFAVNAGGQALSPGAVVTVLGTADTGVAEGLTTALLRVAQAEPGDPIVGVVGERARLVDSDEQPNDRSRPPLISDQGDPAPGDYLSIIYNGPVRVRAASPVEVGQKLTMAEAGLVRPLRTTQVDGMEVAENAPVLGIALESTKPGQDTIWVLVNPQ